MLSNPSHVSSDDFSTGFLALPDDIVGSYALSYLSPIKNLKPPGVDEPNGPNRFYTEVTLLPPPDRSKEFDWFDPWYYNGDTTVGDAYYEQSSHIFWEGRSSGNLLPDTFHEAAGQGLPG